MNGYGWLILVTAMLLLLLPLPALSAANATVDPTPTPPTTTTGTTSTPPVAEEDAAVFRVLCGEEVLTLTEEDFLIRTLAMEMSPATHPEALKAQAVASYTYYARRRQAQREQADPALKGADFATPNAKFPAEYTEDRLRQRWGAQYEAHYAKLAAAVTAVKGVTVTHEGKLIDACYHAISCGNTEAAQTVWGADVPYLQTVASPGDRLAAGYASDSTYTAEEVRQILTSELPDVTLGEDPASWFGEPTLSAAGTVAQQPVGDTQLAGTRVRQLFGLRSAAFAVTYADGSFTFSVRGYGHGVGMSQHGADHLAQQGYTYEEILRYYYTDVTVTHPQ
ncbi:MAG: SpoIID/LytB domain-containing protein [Clostridia bacterium]|nr:SpoIID/LytB domain-containing protein [Clostridia bacterium]